MCSSAAAFLAASRIALASCTSGAVRAEDSDVCEVSLFVTFVMSSLEGDLGGLPADDSASPMIIFCIIIRDMLLCSDMGLWMLGT
mmetsp:Transcript_37783/g.82790  ORF Transcript_37783/g.82790 Transcript_37783/m.82790 type:complete len:85 (+) Transcript_37783:290-544(+)